LALLPAVPFTRSGVAHHLDCRTTEVAMTNGALRLLTLPAVLLALLLIG
jgi:hypothetical protein